MTLGERRALFTHTLADLLVRMLAAGLVPRLDECKRSGVTAEVYGLGPSECDELAALVRPRFPAIADAVTRVRLVNGSRRSVHLEGLAADVLLFDATGKYLDRSEDHLPFGVWWESQHELCRWGGRFADGGHYSVTPDGVRK